MTSTRLPPVASRSTRANTAIDTTNRPGRVRTYLIHLSAALLASAVVEAADAQCVGDCDGNCAINISELILGVNIGLGSQTLEACPPFDADADGVVAIDEPIQAVGNALEGCGPACVGHGSPTPTPTPTPASQTPATPGTTTPGTPTTVTPTATGIPPTPPGGLLVTSAQASDNTTVRVDFNGVIQPGTGLNPRSYELLRVIPPAGQTSEYTVAGPQVVAARFLRLCEGGDRDGATCNDTAETAFTNGAGACPRGSCSIEDRTQVVLSTSAHVGAPYRVRVNGVRDTAGSPNIVFGPLGDRRNEQPYNGRPVEKLKHCAKVTAAETKANGRCAPARCVTSADCPASDPCVDLIPDCDGDGLTDDVEAGGWDVIVGGERSRVTSNPLDVDTDGDGLPDNQEYRSSTVASVSDPRSSDTDGDGLDDYREAVLLWSSPTDPDTDDDGLTDAQEYNFGYSPIEADSDGDSRIDGMDFQGGDPRIADMPAFDIQVGNARVKLKYYFEITRTTGTENTAEKSKEATLSSMSSTSRTDTDTSMREWFAKATLTAKAEYGFPKSFDGSVTFEAQAGVGASGKNEIVSTAAEAAAQARNETTKSGEVLMTGEREERKLTGATVSADVRFINTGLLSMSLDQILVRMRVPDPDNPGEFVTIGTLDAQGLGGPIELGPLTTMRNVPFSKDLDGEGPELVDKLMKNPRSILFDVGNFALKSPPSADTSYVETEASVVGNTGMITVDFAGALDDEGQKIPVQRVFVSSNLGRWEAVRDRNGDEMIDAEDAERVIYLPDGTYLYPRLTEALKIALEKSGMDFTVDPATGQLTSIGGVANDPPKRKAWVVIAGRDSGTPGVPLGAFNAEKRVEDFDVEPASQFWITYLQDADADNVPRNVEELFGCSDADDDSDNDGVNDYDEIFKLTEVTVTDTKNQTTKFTSRSNPIIFDTDGDGLSDGDERTRGTAPDLADSDGDGVSDGDEVNVKHSDPLVQQCPPQTFSLQMFGLGQYLRTTLMEEPIEGCSVTFAAGGHRVASNAECHTESHVEMSYTGFQTCRISRCEVYCTAEGFKACQVDKSDASPTCDPSPHPHCNGTGGFIDLTQGIGYYDIQCE